MNYYKRHIGDYAAKAGHLTPLEHGVYGLLIDAYYNREEAPTKAEAIRWARARTDDELAALDAVLAEFFIEIDGRFTQKRVEEELAQFRVRQEVNRSLGAKGGKANAKRIASETLSEQEANREANDKPSHKPLATSHKPEEKQQQEPGADAPPIRKAKKAKRAEQTFADWTASLGDADAIPATDPVFDYAAKVGLPGEFVQLAWAWFDTTYGAGGDRQTKTYADWRAVFRKAVAGGWPKYWGINRQGEYYLTTEGEQARRALA